MKTIIIRYKVKEDRVEENINLIKKVFEELKELNPADFKYKSYFLKESGEFVHIAEIYGEENPITKVKAFAEFQKDLKDRCIEPPLATTPELIGEF